MPDQILLKQQKGNILLLTFNHEKAQNPFSEALQDAVTAAIAEAENDDNINAIVLYGGENRSFSVGGDFKEAVELGDPAIIANALNKVVDLYVAILKCTKPVIAAVDKHAIGMGFQVAILVDYRICTETTSFIMPELKNGVACTLGCAMTEYLHGRFIMQEICYEGNKIPINNLIHWKIVNETVTESTLVERAIEKAKQYGAYPSKAFRGTKRINNSRFIKLLEEVRQHTIDVHTDVFISKEHRRHMENILGRNKS